MAGTSMIKYSVTADATMAHNSCAVVVTVSVYEPNIAKDGHIKQEFAMTTEQAASLGRLLSRAAEYVTLYREVNERHDAGQLLSDDYTSLERARKAFTSQAQQFPVVFTEYADPNPL